MGSQVPNPEGLPEIRDMLPAPEEVERRTITPLHSLLMQVPLDELCSLIDRMQLKLSITKDGALYKMRVFRDGMLRYQASGKGLKAAITNCLAEVLRGETKDIHEYGLRSVRDMRREYEGEEP